MSTPAFQTVSTEVSGSSPTSGADDDAHSSITIVLADDHHVVRSGLRMLLDAEDGLEVLAEAGDVTVARQQVLERGPRVLILDINMSGESSLSAIPHLRRDSPGTQIVVLTMQDDLAFAREALRAGALGYVLKDAADAELVQAVRFAAEGRTYLNPRLSARLAAEQRYPASAPDDLSPRELEVLKLIALGHTNAEIAATLYLSVRTVESHRAHIQQKTGRTTRAELVGYARQNQLVD
jgi:two-component system response regulator NreC